MNRWGCGYKQKVWKFERKLDNYANLFELLVISTPAALELVENTVILVEDAELIAKVVVDTVGLDRPWLHVKIPDFDV